MQKKILYLLCLLMVSCLSVGCGSKQDQTAQYQWVYKAQETMLSDSEAALLQADFLDEVQRIRKPQQIILGEKVCQIMQLQYFTGYNIGVGNVDLMDFRADEYCLQQWNEVKASWDSYKMSKEEWFPDNQDLASLILCKLVAGREGKLYCVLGLGEDAYLGCWSDDSRQILGKFPEEFLELGICDLWEDNVVFISSEGRLFFYSKESAMILETGDDLKEIIRHPVQGSIAGMIEDPTDHQLYWYGNNGRGAGIWTLDGQDILQGMAELDPSDFLAAFSLEGELYLSDKQALWRKAKEGEPELIWKWREQGYHLEKMTDLTVDGSGTLQLLTHYEGADQLVAIEREWEMPQEKQELVLALSYYLDYSAMHQLIDSFNRKSLHTHVTVRIPSDGQSVFDFMDQLQMEVSAGGGPDMFELLDAKGYVQNGYVLSLEGKLEEVDGLIPGVLDYGKYDGEVYGVPYEAYLSVLVCSEELAAGRSSWNVEEMMESVRQSNAKVLHRDMDGSRIVYWFGLFDKDNREYIDWEKGESHLTDEAFLRLLEFAKEYQNQDVVNAQEVHRLLRNGTIATDNANVLYRGFEVIENNENLFEDGTVYIVLPKVNGKGVYLKSSCIYVNNASQKTEECVEFLNYLVSEEVQRKTSQYVMSSEGMFQIGGSFEMSAPFNIRSDILKEQIQDRILSEDLTQQQADTLWKMLISAEAWKSPVEQIVFMINEELNPYFAGDRTAEEAAEKLHNRVQLYLDEQK